MTKRYFGGFSSGVESVRSNFINNSSWSRHDDPADLPELKDSEVLFAAYGGASYEGAAVVIFERDGQLYAVEGGHCSCYGLEGQWDPKKISWAYLKEMRESLRPYEYEADAIAAFDKLRNGERP